MASASSVMVAISEGALPIGKICALITGTVGPFKVSSMYIKDFIKDYYKNFGHHLINTDLMILNLQLKLVWIFQHEGVYSVIDFKK